jgi:hypothetical protein
MGKAELFQKLGAQPFKEPARLPAKFELTLPETNRHIRRVMKAKNRKRASLRPKQPGA